VASETALGVFDVAGVRSRDLRRATALYDYWALTKPDITFLIAITTAAGFRMGTAAAVPDFPWMALLHSLVGTTLVASGAATLNQFIERPHDARMRRTARRPLASGNIAPSHALWFGVGLSVTGVADLAAGTNVLAAWLAAVTLVSYLFAYTPLKRITPLCTLVGAVPGAAPPLIGWAAARGHLDPAAWGLFAIVFLWQFPHFMPIAWIYRQDYARAGYVVLPAGENRNRVVIWQTIGAAAVLLPVALIPALSGLSGVAYVGGALALGALLLLYSTRFAIHRTTATARQLLLVSILYLPALFALLVLTKT
jgi:protoheme IX farnesyltransferase